MTSQPVANGQSAPRQDQPATPARVPGVAAAEVLARAARRRFSADYKRRILQEAAQCRQPGQIGALLRREGLYSSLLTEWRRAREAGALEALQRPRGRRPAHPLEVENAELRRRAERAEVELAKARRVIEVQGNVSALLGELLGPGGARLDASTEQ